jgi:hypothetical protein
MMKEIYMEELNACDTLEFLNTVNVTNKSCINFQPLNYCILVFIILISETETTCTHK